MRSMIAVAAMLFGAGPAIAAHPIAVTSYDTPNGDGQASGGTYNYWDRNYSGTGATTTDGAPLTGGTGDLTDGVVAPSYWFLTENTAGTGPYVGWYTSATPDPVITFHVAPGSFIRQIDLSVDNSTVGGVFQPAAIKIDGVDTPFVHLAPGTFGVIGITGLGLAGTTHTIELDQQPGDWVFVSEIAFSGSVPEPATWTLLVAGFGVVGVVSRRRGVAAVTTA